MIERERERKEKQPFSGNFTGFCRSELDRTRVKAALRDEGYAWVLNHKISPWFEFSRKPRKGGVLGNHAN